MNLEKLKKLGLNYQEGLSRFVNNDALYMKYLGRFSQDQNEAMLKKYLEDKNYEEAFKAAHSLKGVCGNLSLNTLYESVCIIVESLRNKKVENIEEEFNGFEKLYQQIIEAIEE